MFQADFNLMLVFEDDIKGDLLWMMTNIRKYGAGVLNGRESDMLQFDFLVMAEVVK